MASARASPSWKDFRATALLSTSQSRGMSTSAPVAPKTRERTHPESAGLSNWRGKRCCGNISTTRSLHVRSVIQAMKISRLCNLCQLLGTIKAENRKFDSTHRGLTYHSTANDSSRFGKGERVVKTGASPSTKAMRCSMVSSEPTQ